MLNHVEKKLPFDNVLAGVVAATAGWVVFAALALASLTPLSGLPGEIRPVARKAVVQPSPVLELRPEVCQAGTTVAVELAQ
jgi:hypothetical protein